MKNLSRWAKRHSRTAILIIVICEVCNAFSGLLLGLNLLESWPIGNLLLLGVLLGGGAVYVRLHHHSDQPYWVARRWLFGAFLSNFLLFGVLGGLWAERIQSPTANQAVWGSRRVVMRSDSVVKLDNIRPLHQAQLTSRRTSDENQTGKRIGYVLLFLLSIGLTYVSVGLACNLACSGYGALALLVFLLGMGILAGGIFFLIRSFENRIAPLKEMDKPQRRRTLRRFWLTWLTLIGVVAVYLLSGS